MKKLKYIRLAVSLAFFIILFLAFIGIPALLPSWELIEISTFPQYIPSILRFTALGFMIFGFIVITVVVFLFGRFYCSTFCPLGTMQDIISRIALKFRKKNAYRYSKPSKWLRYGIIILVVLSLFTGSIFLLTLLDPYSNFGKIISGIFRPVAILVNDSLAHFLEIFNIYWISPIGLKNYGLANFVFPFFLFVSLIVMASLRGRLFCNTICPVGTLHGLFSRFSLYKIKFDHTACNKCGKCSTKCKAECIDVKSQKVDFDRCVGCYNCLFVCPKNGINFSFSPKNTISQTDESKRKFFGNIAGLVAGATFISANAKAKEKENENENATKNTIQVKKNLPVSPPGSYSIENFTTHCTACHLCVSTCPTQVLKPSFLEYGFTGMMMPHMSFFDSFCNYECTKCSEVCPNGAINPINNEQKKSIQIGKVIFIKENCVVYTDGTACGACSEHCPTKAVHMVPYKGFITIPETDQNICVGCGACEFACPAIPNKAIFVDGNKVHQTAFKPKEEKINGGVPEEFPF